jgi:hypothetical protein
MVASVAGRTALGENETKRAFRWGPKWATRLMKARKLRIKRVSALGTADATKRRRRTRDVFGICGIRRSQCAPRNLVQISRTPIASRRGKSKSTQDREVWSGCKSAAPATDRSGRTATNERSDIREPTRHLPRVSLRSPGLRGRRARRCRWGKLERVKGIEPSYSAWKAAALPLSYTRIAGDHLTRPRGGLNPPPGGFNSGRCSQIQPAPALTAVWPATILSVPKPTKGGDPVSYLKRCHLAGIAR